MNAPTRPPIRYMGGKWRLAPTIQRFLPPHRIYVEPYGGGASVLLRKPRSYAEVYNDLDGEVVTLFRVLRDPDQAAELIRRLELTPFAREEFEGTYAVSEDPIENARRLIARSFMGFGSTAIALRRRTGFRADCYRSGTTPAADWANLPGAIPLLVDRLRGVVIENRPALQVMSRLNRPDCLVYADPPYLHGTRSQKRIGGALEHAYKHEMSDADHQELLEHLVRSKAMVVLSGYASPLYDDALQGWQRVSLRAHADGARPRTEVLWINPAAASAHGLFGGEAA